MGQNEGRWQKIVYEKDPTKRYCTSCSKQGHAKSNCKLRSKKSSTTDAAKKEKSNQQPSAPNSNAYRKKSAQGQGANLWADPRKVYRPTGKTIQSSFENTYNLPNKTADNQTEQNLFLLIKRLLSLSTYGFLPILQPVLLLMILSWGLILLIR